MTKLYNVVDTRTGRFYSEVIVDEKRLNLFVQASEEENEETDADTDTPS